MKETVIPVKDLPKPLPVKSEVKTTDSKKVIFKIQIKASASEIEAKPENFNGLDTISYIAEKGYFKYMYGETNNYETSKSQLAEAKAKGYESAFIVAFKNGNKISLNEALKTK